MALLSSSLSIEERGKKCERRLPTKFYKHAHPKSKPLYKNILLKDLIRYCVASMPKCMAQIKSHAISNSNHIED